MQTIVTDVRGVCHSVCPFVSLSVMRLNCVWCIHAAFAKLLWPLVCFFICKSSLTGPIGSRNKLRLLQICPVCVGYL